MRAMYLMIILQQGEPYAGWADQYTVTDLKPAHARSYEPRSVNTGTTVGMIYQMMEYYKLTADTRFLSGLPAAIKFLESQKLPETEVRKWHRKSDNPDEILVPRFIDPDTGKPLYVHRKGGNIYNGKYYIDQNIENTIPSIPLNDYEQIIDISIDYALMEKSKKITIVPLNTEWKDIGSWKAIYEISQKDENGNYFSGNVVDIDSKNSMVYSTSKLVATLGLKDTFVIETEDAVLVSDKADTNSIKNIYKKLNGKNSSKKEIHKTVYRPWGYYTVLENGNGFLTKCITVNPNAKLSVQLHHHRSEHWIILEGEATILKGKEFVKLLAGESIDIAIEEIHSLQNFGTEQLKVLEIQQGDILDENDIERLEDIYGRA